MAFCAKLETRGGQVSLFARNAAFAHKTPVMQAGANPGF